ncbi:MAG: GNAT family N-acyltransferase [Pseudomonadota bacterium]|nr:GNAT family N-acyltransferase [Pseudomonadota bacterium]
MASPKIDLLIEGGLSIGNLEVRLAQTPKEIDAAQNLRYRVFYDEMQANPELDTKRLRRDIDKYDSHCDHLLVFDRDYDDPSRSIIGAYRLMRSDQAAKIGSFYTAGEYDIAPLLGVSSRILEIGRTCVDARYRTRPTMQLLWTALAAYVLDHDIEYIFGCGSFPGSDPSRWSLPLSYLYHYHLATPELRPRALNGHHVDMNLMPAEAIRQRDALIDLPPLIKGYIRIGGMVGDGAFIDYQFNTTDVCVLVQTNKITSRYIDHYRRSMLTAVTEKKTGS